MALSRNVIVRRNRIDHQGKVVGQPVDQHHVLVRLKRDDSQILARIASVRLASGQYLEDLAVDKLEFEPEPDQS